jgi:group I intron endonuclease
MIYSFKFPYKTGIIYKLTFPNGKSYIGQTIQTFNNRFRQHISSAFNKCGGCRLLSKAIRKYGEKSIKIETILHYCHIDYLDMWEAIFIKYYKTLAPCGYNLQTGGNSNKKFSINTIEKMRLRNTKSYRKSDITKELPKYVLYIENKDRKGYRIDRHPLCRSKYFCTPKYTLEENLKRCLMYLNDLNRGKIIHKTRLDNALPKGIQRSGTGYRVVYKTHIKTFHSKKLSMETKLELAITCLKEFQAIY